MPTDGHAVPAHDGLHQGPAEPGRLGRPDAGGEAPRNRAAQQADRAAHRPDDGLGLPRHRRPKGQGRQPPPARRGRGPSARARRRAVAGRGASARRGGNPERRPRDHEGTHEELARRVRGQVRQASQPRDDTALAQGAGIAR
ncbi:hypothetical protein ABG067_008086 [Albugo candida]